MWKLAYKNFTWFILEHFAPYMDWHKEITSTTIKLILTLCDFYVTVIWFTFLSNQKKGFSDWSSAFNSILLYKSFPDYLFQIKILSLKLYGFIFFLVLFFCFVRVFVVSFFSYYISFLVTYRLALPQFQYLCGNRYEILLLALYFSY